MSDLRDFENELRTTLTENERALRPDADLADRLIAGATGRHGTVHRIGARPVPRWLPPLLAAAAVVALVAGGTALANTTLSDRDAPPASSVPTHRPSPAPVTTPVTSPPTSDGTTGHASPVVGPVGTAVPTGFTAADVQFIDAQHGWGLGNVPCSTSPGYCATVVRTVDGGAHWVAFAAPTGVTPVNDQGHSSGGSCGTNGTIYGPCVNKIAFADAHHGYLWGTHSFYATSDGGTTWNKDSGSATAVAFSGSTALRLAYPGTGSSGVAGWIETAPLGTDDWHKITVGGTLSAFGSRLVAAPDGSGDVYLLAAELDPVSDAVTTQQLFRSTDGGAHWTVRSTNPCGSATAADDLSVGTDGSVALTCSVQSGTAVRVSTDQGATFGSAHLAKGEFLLARSERVLLSAPLSTDQSAYLSTDGGAAWHKISTVSPDEGWGFTSASVGYIVNYEGSGVQVTGNGGQSWSTRSFT